MVTEVAEIISKDFEEIKGSSLSLQLLKCYSTLYLHGGRPSSCERSMRKYYNELKKTGIKKAEKMENVTKTNKTRVKGIRLIGRPIFKQLDFGNLSDADAINLLGKGILKEKDFITLPDGYKKPEKKTKAKPAPKKAEDTKKKEDN
jgi:hypothetical protein